MNVHQLQGRVALVTGAAKGIGSATAAILASEGAAVIVADADRENGEAVAETLRSGGARAKFIHTDVGDDQAVADLVAQTVSAFGRLDIAVNNAAIRPDTAPLDAVDFEAFDAVLRINLRSVAVCLKYELKQMLRQGEPAAIVNVASICGLRPQAASPAYVASKSGVIGLTKSASLDYAGQGIRVNCVAPGLVDTPMVAAALPNLAQVKDQIADRLSLFRRFGQAEEVARAILWLCSDGASLVTGTVLPVDGGYSSM
jgi:NAD(P)-dependent dehydrogenase (short-subunit alcohol dehydrogenase family)